MGWGISDWGLSKACLQVIEFCLTLIYPFKFDTFSHSLCHGSGGISEPIYKLSIIANHPQKISHTLLVLRWLHLRYNLYLFWLQLDSIGGQQVSQIVEFLFEEKALALLKSELSLLQPG